MENKIHLSKKIDVPHDAQLNELEESQACSIDTYLVRRVYKEEYKKYCNINDEFKKLFFNNIVNVKNDNF